MTGTSITNYLSSKILKIFSATNITAPANVFGALYTAIPSDTAGSGTEATFTSYARQDITFDSTPVANAGGGMKTSNTVAVDFPTNTGSTQVIVGGQVMDADTAGNGLMWGYSDQSISYGAGQTKSVDIGDWVLAVD